MNSASIIALGTILGTTAAAQWMNYPTPGVPRTKDGKANLTARALRMPDGRPDLSGVWHGESAASDAPQGTNGDALPKYFLDITRDLAPAEVPFQPWAADLYEQRKANFGKDDPISRCLPLGVPRSDADGVPMKIIQTRDLVAILQEGDGGFRQIFLDGRPLPVDPQPSWRGYSVGKWEGQVLVVETRGFNDRGWLDAFGHPHSDALRVVERFRRRDFGHLDIQITIDDPKAYRRPLTYTQSQVLMPDTDLLELVCKENERDSKHFVGR
jgi:hypothetical protein